MLDEVVEVVDTELLGYLDFLVGDGAKAAVFHADHDDRAGEAVTVQCQEVHLALVERASGDALCLIEHVMVQLICVVPHRARYGAAHWSGCAGCSNRSRWGWHPRRAMSLLR